MKKRPFIIKLIALCLILSPIWFITQTMYIFKIQIGYIASVFKLLNWHGWTMLIVSPLVGVGVFKVKKWGFYLLCIFAALSLVSNITIYATGLTTFPIWLIILLNVLILAGLILFVRKEVYAPYFNPNLRWWEQAKRYYYQDMKVLIKEFGTNKLVAEANSFDISESGVFIASDKEVAAGELYSLEMQFAKGGFLFSDAEVVWVNKEDGSFPKGFGCRFVDATSFLKRRIRFHMKEIGAKIKER
jgi:hypothetical protein